MCIPHTLGHFFTFSCVSPGGCRAVCGHVRGGSVLLPVSGRLRMFLRCHRGLRSSLFREGCGYQLEVQ